MKPLFISIFLFCCFISLRTCLGEPHGDGKDHPIYIGYQFGKHEDENPEIILDKNAGRVSHFGRKPDNDEAKKVIVVDALQPKSERLSSINKEFATEQKSDTQTAAESEKAPSTKITQKSTTIKVTKKQKNQATSTPVEVPTTQVPPADGSTGSSVPSIIRSTTIPASTTLPPTTTQPKPLPEDLYCFCDIHSYACDMNCCCDAECTNEDRQFFTHCEDQVGIHDERSSPRRQRSCYKSFVTFKHYTAESGVVNDNGMLCIVRDNSKADNILPSTKLSEIRKRISDGEISIQPKYFIDSSRKLQYKQEPYKFGNPIIGMKTLDLSKEKVDLIPYGFPATYLASPCTNVKEPVKFLQNFYSRCQLSITNLTQDCNTIGILNANSFINQMQILKNPEVEDSKKEFILITARKVCNDDLCNELNKSDLNEFPSPIYNSTKHLCQNVLIGFNVTFYFGLEGISDIFASAQLQDVSISTKQFTQEFRSNFQWNTELNNTEVNSTATPTLYENSWPRSGNPGYIVGKPIIMGEKVTIMKEIAPVGVGKEVTTTETPNSEEENKEVEMVKVSKDNSRWMSIHAPGKCPENPEISPRKPVLFDYSHMTVCSLNLTQFKYCEDLQLQVAKVFLGVSDPVNFEKRKWHIAVFGNSNPKIASGWVPLSTKNFPVGVVSTLGNSKGLVTKGCDYIISSLHITVTYAFVGSVDFPQAKITGVLYEPGESVSFLSKNLSNNFDISTTVSFKDVTAPAIMRVAKWPVLSINLPKDFFYPFSH